MERDNIDVLLMQNNSDQMGGYVEYFTDLPATNGYPLTVVFPRDDLMTLVSRARSAASPSSTVKATAPAAASSRVHDAELRLLSIILRPTIPNSRRRPRARCRRHHRPCRHLSGRSRWSITCRRAASPIPNCRCVRSGRSHQGHQERRGADLVRRAAAMQDAPCARPLPRSSRACATATLRQLHNATASATAANTASICAPRCRPGKPAESSSALSNRVIQEGDAVALLVEDAGPAACIPSSAARVVGRDHKRCGTNTPSR